MSHKENDKFSLEHFKKWMKTQKSSIDEFHGMCRQKSFIGTLVESKIDSHRLRSKMHSKEGNTSDLIENFLDNGGTVADMDDKDFLIEVESGSFRIHRCYVRKI
jgi:hypothetical protein